MQCTITGRRRGFFLSVLFLIVLFVLQSVYAEKEQFYTSDDEFLPLGTKMTEEEDKNSAEFLKDETFLRNALVKGIKLLKDGRELSFLLSSATERDLERRNLKYMLTRVNFPPRVILRLYGVRSEEKPFHFFKNLEIVGIVCNPFLEGYYTEYVIFFKEWIVTQASYDQKEMRLTIAYEFEQPDISKGYGVRIADTKIDPLPQVIEIYNELRKFGLECHLLVASDQKTVVLESPFYGSKEEAVEYLEELEDVGFKGKLAIRNYLDFPQPDRFDVVTEPVVTGEDDVTLKNLVYGEFMPQKIHDLNYSEIFSLTISVFSPRIQKNQDAIADFYYRLSEMYKNYETDEDLVIQMAILVSIKIQEVIIFKYPLSQSADDALWEMANTIREYEIRDRFSEEDCYKKLISDYPRSMFREEAKVRLALLRNPDAFSN
jgi:hypothetical protein